MKLRLCFAFSFFLSFSKNTLDFFLRKSRVAVMQHKVYYRFRNECLFDFVEFDGASLSVRDLKQAIVNQRKLTTHGMRGFDLVVSDTAETGTSNL